MHDLIILGGGPAGLTAAIYAIRKGLDVLLVTRDLGGKSNFHLQLPFVDPHKIINGAELVQKFEHEIKYLDFVHMLDSAVRVEAAIGGYQVEMNASRIVEARTLIVATGANPRRLDVPGEAKFRGRGLSYSALSYAHLMEGRQVAVIGGGRLALRAVAELRRIAQHVTLIAPPENELDTEMGRRLLASERLTVLPGYDVREITGDSWPNGLRTVGPAGPCDITAEAIFIEMGLIPQSELVAHLVDLDEHQRIRINARNETTTPGIFAAGDVTDGFAEQELICIGEGAKAALSAYQYLLDLESPAGRDS
jgi:NADH-dependent peroxiredoxin subunit F